jgi:uncharacterized coiled-coil protein SlyX
MNEQNIDVNLIIQSFQERINQLLTEVIVKEATIKQLSNKLIELQEVSENFETPQSMSKKDK